MTLIPTLWILKKKKIVFVTHQKHKLISKSCFRWQKQGWYIGIKTTLFPFWLGFDSQIWLRMWVKFCVVFSLQGFLSAFSFSSLSSSQTESCSCCISFPICLLVYYFCDGLLFLLPFCLCEKILLGVFLELCEY